ncbi:hypothetical protein [Rhizobium sp. AN80A]|uniref:hypothetical protein n=1 Tax=Rhizobium sp. AN80A TaxID=3040673 RepID=UPI000DB9B67B|nr:hypothetical protein [Rhizobium sp. AN80A]
MPPLISFIISRLAIGFALGAVTGLAIWWVGFSAQFSEGASGHWIAQLLFVYVFGSSMAAGYLATALFQDD